MRRLGEIGVDVDDAVKAYVSKIKEGGSSRNSDWLRLIKTQCMMDDHILMGALSEMDFPLGTVVVPPNTAHKVLAAAEGEADEDAIQGLTNRLKPLFTLSHETKVLIPLADERHWGMIVVSEGRIYWGDSLGWNPFGNVIGVVYKIVKRIVPEFDWKKMVLTTF